MATSTGPSGKSETALVPVPQMAANSFTKPPTGREKAALMLASLGTELSAEVLKFMPGSIVEHLIADMLTLRRFDPAMVDRILSEGMDRMGISPAIVAAGGLDAARDILTRVLGPSAAEDVIKRINAQGTNAPFQFLRDIDRNQLADFFATEHPQTIALVLSRTAPDLTAQMLQRLEPNLRVEVALRIATMESTPPEVVREVELLLKQRLSGALQRNGIGAGGVDFLVQVLMRSDRSTEKSMLEHLDSTAPELAEQIRAKMFVFEDIGKLDNRTIQRIIREVDLKDLAKGLRGSKEEMRRAIFRNMSSRAAEMLMDEIETMGAMRSDQISRAQRNIVNVVRRLEEQEEIVINRGNENELV